MISPQHNIRMDRETWRRLRHAAIDLGVSTSALIEGMVTEWLASPSQKWAQNVAETAQELQKPRKRGKKDE